MTTGFEPVLQIGNCFLGNRDSHSAMSPQLYNENNLYIIL